MTALPVNSNSLAMQSSAPSGNVVGDPSALPTGTGDTFGIKGNEEYDARVANYSASSEGGTGGNSGASTASSVADNADYVGNVNVTDTTTDILTDPNAFIDSNDARLSDQVPTIDANAEGTTLDGSNYDMDVDRLNVANNSAAVDTAANVVKPREASTYDAATTAESVKANLATAATMDTNPDAVVDGDKLALDKQGLATGINEDGSINETGAALNSFAHQNISSVIDTTTVSGKLLAQTLGEGNYTDSKATITGQLDILTAEFTNPVTGEPKIPTWAAGIARGVSRTIAFTGMSGTAATAAMSQALIEATLPIAKAESEFYQTLTIKNLDNKQEQIINKANVLSKFELADLDNRTQVAVNNAKTFMTYDMKNLENEQQAEIINTQAKVQSILEDANQTNVARRFGSESTNEMNKFYDNLGATIDMYNTGQRNSMAQFNSGEANDTAQFNATLENSREQFYLNMQYDVDKDNVKWRQDVTVGNAEMEFQAAATDVKNTLDISTETLNQLWDRTDSLLDYSWKEGENAEDRENKLEMKKLDLEAAKAQAEAESDSGLFGAIGSVAGAVLGGPIGKTIGGAIGGALDD